MNVPPFRKRVFLVGAMRAGTTSLYQYLSEHPDIFPSRVKEPRFFCQTAPGPAEIAEYDALFAGQTRERWAFEASTHYTRFPKHRGVPERIRQAFPDARIIYLVRHPIDRIASAYLHWRSHGRERRGLEEAVLTEPSEYLDVSRYWMQLDHYRRVFPPDQILVLVFESFIRDTVGTVKRVCEFLDIDATFDSPNLRRRFNESNQEGEPGAVLSSLRRSGLYGHLPWRIRRWADTTLRRELPDRRRLVPDSVRHRILERLEDDLTGLKAALGDSVSGWDLSRR